MPATVAAELGDEFNIILALKAVCGDSNLRATILGTGMTRLKNVVGGGQRMLESRLAVEIGDGFVFPK